MSPSVHISLNVHDLGRSVAFYRGLFGEPAKLKPDYAKFVARDPEIHLALVPGLESGSHAGALSHLGIRVGTLDEVRAWKTRLHDRGVGVEDEERTECCYALQEKFWLTDPDGNRWEIYTVLEDVGAVKATAASTCCSR
jgi:catechol 2,3-dioxygenase-like lactoylglutathione lyase family enzyme